MIEELIENESLLNPEHVLLLAEAIGALNITQSIVIWYWLLGFTQEETRHKLFPGRSRAHIWQQKVTALKTIKDNISMDLSI